MSVNSTAPDPARVLAEDDALHDDCPVAQQQRQVAEQARQKPEPVTRAWNDRLDRLERGLAAVTEAAERDT